jgi:tetratricopeptide (TPR) repeat protein
MPDSTPSSPVRVPRRARVLLLGILALAGAGCAGDVDSRLEQVRAVQDAGDFSNSIPPLREILESYPDHPEANHLLGVALVQTQRPTLAIWPLRKAAESNEFAVPAGLLLASTLLSTSGFEEAITATDKLLEKDPNHVGALLIRIQALIGIGRNEEALADSEKVLELKEDGSGQGFQALAARGTALQALDRLEEAEKNWIRLDQATAASGDPSAEMRGCIALAQFYRATKSDKTAAVIDRCVEQFPSDLLVLGMAAQYYDATERSEQATALYRKAVDEQPDKFQLRAALATRLGHKGQPEEAEKVLREAAELFDEASAWNQLGMFYQSKGDWAKASEANDKAMAAAPAPSEELLFRKLDLLIQLGQLDEAEKLSAELSEGVYRDLIRGKLLLQRNDVPGALQAFEDGLTRWPNNAPARFLAGQAAERLGQRDVALAHYREAVRSDDSITDAALAAATLQLANGNYGDADQLAQRQISKRPFQGPEPYVIVARAALAEGRYAEGRRALEALAKLTDDALTVKTERAALERGAEGPAAAAEVIEKSGLDLRDPANQRALRSLVEDLVALGRHDAALARVDAALVGHADDASLHELRGRALYAAGRKADARAELERALALDADHAPALSALSRIALEEGRPDEAIVLADRAVAANPADAESAYIAANVRVGQGKLDEAVARLKELLRSHPGHAGAANDLAWILAERGQDTALALDLAKRAARIDPRPETLDTLGFVQLERNDAAAAVESFEKSLALDPNAASVRYRLGLALETLGRSEEALENFRAALGSGAFAEADAARAEVARLEANAGNTP